ncbi:2Fe-2S iron-sulfur cluster-binding protein [Paractinoplanes lichenicola]|uniref:2Fe-2S iron-sulfur cluster binding domain-containing protein n=1 Tax=Paractinoplanes lichenicola TaxID=2802976 RepID=A0ABS1VND4_9ACTN|nr:2Fe-2S iron-sulfur cluster-binding protein [Actinoplanes lichenicola]MBL7255981.1 2Fe-2S iron-sulfur cluster binding domain-containing protein [Actinoplanes lichenicola]
MPKVTYVSDEGEVRVVDSAVGDSVMQTAVRNGVPGIVGECGGVLSCATCHVFVDEALLDRLPPMTDLEDEMLDGTVVDRCPNSRLSCQLKMSDELGDLRVTTPEAQE